MRGIMHKISFSETLHLAFQSKVNKINYDFHIRTTDYPFTHGHNGYWEFTMLTEGSIYNIIDNEKFLCRSPCVFYATTKNEHCLKKANKSKIRYINLIVREKVAVNIINSLSENALDKFYYGKHCYPVTTKVLEEITNIISKAGLLQPEQYNMRDNLICSSFLLILQQIYFQKIEEIVFDGEEANDFVKKLNALMYNPKFPTYTVNDLCLYFSYSRTQLFRIFKTNFKYSPHDYLINIKFTYAKNLLTDTDMSIKEIAYAIGYSSITQFHRTFKQLFNTTPSKYRKAYLTPLIYTHEK